MWRGLYGANGRADFLVKEREECDGRAGAVNVDETLPEKQRKP